MINGRFVVFGTPNYLMETYGLGYMFSITIDLETISIEKAKLAITKALPSAQYIDQI
jgi:hypothetical protein